MYHDLHHFCCQSDQRRQLLHQNDTPRPRLKSETKKLNKFHQRKSDLIPKVLGSMEMEFGLF